MTVTSTVRRAGPYTGNAVQTAFPFSFKIYSATDIVVTQADLNGAETVLVLTSAYTVAVNADQNNSPGGTVNLVTALPANYKVAISGAVPNSQSTDLTNLGGFYPDVIESMSDRSTIQIQQLAEAVSRTVTVPVTSSVAQSTSDLIAAINAASAKVTAFNGVYYGAFSVDPTLDPNGNVRTSGDMYYNTPAHQLKIFDASLNTWNAQPSGTSMTFQIFSGTGAQVNYTLSRDPAQIGNMFVFVAGALLRPGVDYSYIGTTLTFVVAPPATANNIVVYILTALTAGTIDWANITNLPAVLPAASAANLTNLNASQLTSGTVPAARITSVDPTATISAHPIGYRNIPASLVTSGPIGAADVSTMVKATGNITIATGVFAADDALTVMNNSASPLTISGTIPTIRLAGNTTTGTRTLAPRALAFVYFNTPTEVYISGPGVT
jgi:hypothetical protein